MSTRERSARVKDTDRLFQSLDSYLPYYAINYQPLFYHAAAAITGGVLHCAEGEDVELSWIPSRPKDTCTRNVHATTAIKGIRAR